MLSVASMKSYVLSISLNTSTINFMARKRPDKPQPLLNQLTTLLFSDSRSLSRKDAELVAAAERTGERSEYVQEILKQEDAETQAQAQLETKQLKQRVLADRQAKANHSAEFFQKAADTFYERRGLLQHQKRNIGFDLIERDETGAVHEKLRLHLWTRKELYTTKRWLQADITRLIRMREPKRDESRHRLLVRRREQLGLVTQAMADFKPLHDTLRKVRRQVQHGTTRKERRHQLYRQTQTRKRNIRAALNATRQAIGKAPLPTLEYRGFGNPFGQYE